METAQATIVVTCLIHHGDYRESFVGSGSSIEEAAREAAAQSTYTADLYNELDSYYERRESYRRELVSTLEAGGSYRGFGWATFSRLA